MLPYRIEQLRNGGIACAPLNPLRLVQERASNWRAGWGTRGVRHEMPNTATRNGK
jgi:hypothetical protein